MSDNKIIMTQGGKDEDAPKTLQDTLDNIHAKLEREKIKLAYIMEQAHKAGRKPFDTREFLNYYRYYYGGLDTIITKEQIEELVENDENLFSYKWDYYCNYTECESSKEFAILLNQKEAQY